MSESKSGNHNIIYNSNKEMLDYFNNIFLKDLENIQELKTQIFEIDVRIDELYKTKNLYAFKSSSRRNVFTPIAPDTLTEDESTYIQEQIDILSDEKHALHDRLRTLERTLNTTKKRLASLQEAKKAIQDAGLADEADIHSSITHTDSDGLQFVENGSTYSNLTHNYNILMQEAFNNSFLSTVLNKSVIDKLSGTNHKLDMLPNLMTSDINRAKLTIDEIKKNNAETASTVKDIIKRIDSPVDSSKPIWSILDEFVMSIRDEHPECVIDAAVEVTDYSLNLHPMFTINLMKLLNIFFDNIFKHANANKIDFKLSLTPNIVDVIITDNGVGIKDDYLESSPWYSSLHQATEIIYLLDGSLNIKGDVLTGTSIRFNFSIKH